MALKANFPPHSSALLHYHPALAGGVSGGICPLKSKNGWWYPRFGGITPSKQTLGFFNQNLILEYPFERAVADGVNVDFDLYSIRTLISEHGSLINAGFQVDYRDRQTRKVRWELADQDIPYDSDELDRHVVVPDPIRTIVRTFRDRLFTDIFPGRTKVPKTLIFAKDDSHADDIVQILREEFGRGNDFAQKITYRTGAADVRVTKTDKDGNAYEVDEWKSTGITPEQHLTEFRIAYNPRIAVTVDMIATGTDIKPLEIVFFMRAVKSRTMFEQTKGRGSRVVTPTELQNVTPRALIQAIVDVMHPKPGQLIHDPACGTGGFLLAVHDYISKADEYKLDKDDKRFLKEEALSGVEIVDGTARLPARRNR